MMSSTSKLNEIFELRDKLKEYLYLYYITKDSTYKVLISSVDRSIKNLESLINTRKGD